jgi:hydroxymethylpyrimidine/phosphomethylpyrimidine kinase
VSAPLRKKQDLPSPKSSGIPKNPIGGAYTGTTVSVWKWDENFGKRRNCSLYPKMRARPVVLTIAGFDPGSGAGITADLKTFAAHGTYGVACITALTVQSTLGVRAVEPLRGSLVRQTLDCLVEDVSLSGVKIGMLGSSGVADEVASFLTAQSGNIERARIVLDPVLRSTSGTPLIDENGVRIIRNELLKCVSWITPNIHELAILTGGYRGPLSREQVPAAAAELKRLAARLGNDELNVVVTGGHLSQPDDFLLTASGAESWFPGEKIATTASHGTGCAFSSAMLCGLISGQGPEQAVAAAKAYVTEALRAAYPVGKGKGPMNHLFSFDHSFDH